MILDVNHVSIEYMTGDFREIGLKEFIMRKLTKTYQSSRFMAVRDVSFSIDRGDLLGIVGANGAGKSTLMKAVSGVLAPTRGSVTAQGRVIALLELGAGFDGDLTVKENIFLRGALLGFTRDFIQKQYDEIIAFSELGEFEDRPFRTLSSGMASRLAFSISSLVQPDILILDEILSVGDGAFQEKSAAKMKEIINGGAATILVSHALPQIREMSTKVLWLDRGRQIAFGKVDLICDRYAEYLETKVLPPDGWAEENGLVPVRNEKPELRFAAPVDLKNLEKTALIMAGGRGERFWPESRQDLPKQFLSLTTDGKTMLQSTVERILPLVKMDNIYVVTNEDYESLVLEQLPNLPEENILCEPVGRNTAPCIGLGAVHIQKKFKDALMLVLPSDHIIGDIPQFLLTVDAAFKIAAENSNLVTLGIHPDFAETGYGYIKFNKERSNGAAFAVDQFVEKPDLQTAEMYVREGNYLWNSGMFIWKASSILSAMNQLMPDLYTDLCDIQDTIGKWKYRRTLARIFDLTPSVSIDYGIMEKADGVFIIPGNFGWDDVGSWNALRRINPVDADGNYIEGDVMSVDSKDCSIKNSSEQFIAAVGLSDLIVVNTPDALLVCRSDQTQKIKTVVEKLRESKREKILNHWE